MSAALAAEQQAPVSRQHGAARQGRESFRRYVHHAAVTGQWLVWAEFAERAWRDLTRAVQEGRALANATNCANLAEAKNTIKRELTDQGLDWQGEISPPGQFFTSLVNGRDWPGKAAFAGQIASESEAMAAYRARVKANEEYLEAYAKVSLKKYRPMAARNEDKKVFSGLL